LLEHDLGGRILERTSTGVRPTPGGHALAQKAKLVLDDYDSTMGDVRCLVRGEHQPSRRSPNDAQLWSEWLKSSAQ